MSYLFLQEDYDKLRLLVEVLEGRKVEALSSIRVTTVQSSETPHENSAFEDVRQQAHMWQHERNRMREILGQAVVVPATDQTKTVSIGSRVQYRNVETGFVDEVIIGSYMRFGSSRDEQDEDVLVASGASPIGSALSGRSTGDIVTVEFKDDRGTVTRRMKVEILAISIGIPPKLGK